MTQPEDPQQTTPPTPTPEADLASELAEARAELKEARRAAAAARTEARTRTEQVKGQLTEAEQRERALEQREQAAGERERKAQDRDDRAAVADAARTLGFRDPADAFALIRDDLDRDADGQLRAPDKALRQLLRDKPYLGAGTGAGADAGAGRGGGAGTPPGSSFNDSIRAAAGRR